MIKTLLIFGSNGMLGRYFTNYFKDKFKIIPVTRNDFEINSENIHNIEDLFVTYKIDNTFCIINCSGLIPQRFNEKETNNYYIVNSIFPLTLSNLSKKYNCKLICPTTDCVYTGKKGTYIETDYHDEKSAYGLSKSLGEPMYGTVIRTSIIGEEIQNKKSFLEWVKNASNNITGWDNHKWNGITCLEYCKIIEKIINDNLFWNGIRHIYSPEVKSKYELANIIKNTYKLNININKLSSDINIDKTLSSIYDTNNMFNIPTLEQQIKELSEFKIY